MDRWGRARRSEDIAVQAQNIGRIYQNDENSDELRDAPVHGIFVDKLVIERGRIVAIIGESGSGKSTLLGLISGLTKNNVEVPNKDLQELIVVGRSAIDLSTGRKPAPGDVGFIFQDVHLIKYLSVKQNAQLAECAIGMQTTDERTAGLLETLGLGADIEKAASSISGGQAQRLALARAISTNPPLLVCDEPTSNLDSQTGKAVIDSVHGWATKNGSTVLWVTHNIGEAAQIADSFLVVHDGRLFSDDGAPFELIPAELQERIELLEEAKRSVQYQALASKRTVDDAIAASDTVPAVVCSPQRSDNSKKNWLAAYQFVLSTVLAGSFSQSASSVFLRGAAKGLMLQPLYWIFLLAWFVFYGIDVSRSIADQYYQTELQSPQTSHFVVKSSGGSDLLRPDKVDLFGDFLGRAELFGPPPKVYGRREHHQTPVWVPDTSSWPAKLDTEFAYLDSQACVMDGMSSGQTSSMYVFDGNEPLFDEINTGNANSVPSVGATRALASQQFIIRLNLKPIYRDWYYVCMGEYLPTLVEISKVLDVIPGGGEYSYDFAITNTQYEGQVRAKPKLSNMDGGRVLMPPFQSLAVYFDYRDAHTLACKLEGCESSKIEGLKVDLDNLDQISYFLKISGTVKSMLNWLSYAFIAAVGIMIILASILYLQKNEKSLCIMKLFGFNLFHLISLMSCRLLVFGVLALPGAVLIMMLARIFANPTLERLNVGLVIPVFEIEALLSSATTLGCLGLGTVTVVMALWWSARKYLGPTLQSE